VYVRPFPGPGGRWQVSSSGGIHPRWSAKTHELMYQTSTREVMRVEYSATADSFSLGRSRAWPSVQLADAGPNAVFDVSPDGKHLAAVLPVVPAGGERILGEVAFLSNFFDELKRRAPGR
jgi:serine/threonine-protein kinase